MKSFYRILFLFESQETIILELQRMDLTQDADSDEIYHWLHIDKKTLSMIKLWFRSTDSSEAIQERFFEQGYLKFSVTEATYIEKYNSSQHKLVNNTARSIAPEVEELIRNYLSEAK